MDRVRAYSVCARHGRDGALVSTQVSEQVVYLNAIKMVQVSVAERPPICCIGDFVLSFLECA